MAKWCKVCGELLKPNWIKEHSKDVYSKYCSEECKKSDEITIMKEELNLMVQELNTYYYKVNRDNVNTIKIYSADFMSDFDEIKKKYGYK